MSITDSGNLSYSDQSSIIRNKNKNKQNQLKKEDSVKKTANSMNEWADFWRNEIGANVIPADSKYKKTWVEWKQYQNSPIAQEQHDKWKSMNVFDHGIAVMLGCVYHHIGRKDLYLVGIDLDNKQAINAVCNIRGKQLTIHDLAEQTLVEAHEDEPSRAHIYVYSEKPFPSVKSKNENAIEVKSEGAHGLHYCAGSIHKSGAPYRIIGVKEPFKNEEFVEHVLNVSGYKDKQFDRIPVKERAKFDVYEGNNRHEAVMAYAESLLFNGTVMAVNTEDDVKQLTRNFNNKRCKPPLDDSEFDKQFEAAKKFVAAKTDSEPQQQQKIHKNLSLEDIEKLTQQVMSECHYKTLSDTEEMLYYDEQSGVYVKNGQRHLKIHIENMMRQITDHSRQEIIKHVNIRTDVDREDLDCDLNVINMKSGLYHIDTNTLTPHTPDFLSVKQIPIEYNPDVKPKEFFKFLEDVLYPSDIETAIEIMAYTFWRDNPYEIITVLLGVGGNGKSVYTGLINALHGGKQNVSNVPMKDLVSDRFGPSDLVGKNVNIDPETKPVSADDLACIRRYTGTADVRTQNKNEKASDNKIYAKFIFSANKMLDDDDTSAHFRRNITIAFPKIFDNGQADPDKLKKLTTSEELSGIFNVLMNALRNILKRNNGIYTSQASIEDRRKQSFLLRNPEKAFMEQWIIDTCANQDEWPTKASVYQAYCKFCQESRLPVQKDSQFGDTMKNRHGWKDHRPWIAKEKRKVFYWTGVKLRAKSKEEEEAENEDTMRREAEKAEMDRKAAEENDSQSTTSKKAEESDESRAQLLKTKYGMKTENGNDVLNDKPPSRPVLGQN